MRRHERAVLAVLLGIFALAYPGRAAAFDYFVLALSWTPSWCSDEGDARADARCVAGARNGWLVHGLWPQFSDGGWPEYCQTTVRPASRAQTAAMLDIMGSSALAWHQWRKHGTCSDMTAQDYFATTRAAFRAVELPDLFTRIERDIRVDPQSVETAFLNANQKFASHMMAVTCPRDKVTEIRICLNRSLQPTPCDAQLLARSCARNAALLPALR